LTGALSQRRRRAWRHRTSDCRRRFAAAGTVLPTVKCAGLADFPESDSTPEFNLSPRGKLCAKC
jgi:hypothetical protein